jgi:hypothetical protein
MVGKPGTVLAATAESACGTVDAQRPIIETLL